MLAKTPIPKNKTKLELALTGKCKSQEVTFAEALKSYIFTAENADLLKWYSQL